MHNAGQAVGTVKVYYLMRDEDVSGSSGTGVVAEVYESSLGPVYMYWLDGTSEKRFNTIEDVIKIHGHGGRTYLVLVSEVDPNMRDMALSQPKRVELAEKLTQEPVSAL